MRETGSKPRVLDYRSQRDGESDAKAETIKV